MSLSLVTAPVDDLLARSLAKLQARVTQTSEDSLFDEYLKAARERGEGETGRAFGTQTWDWVLPGFGPYASIEIPKPPLQSVTYVKYLDTTGTLQTWAPSNYVVEAPVGPRCRRGRITLASGVAWPSTYGQDNDVQIRFICGYTQATFPSILRQAMLLDVATNFRNRESIVTGTIVATIPGTAADIYRRYVSHGTQRRPS